MKRIIHVHQQKVRKGEPAIIVRTYKGTTHCASADCDGPFRIVHDYDKPLSCGAKVWIETDTPVVAVMADGDKITI